MTGRRGRPRGPAGGPATARAPLAAPETTPSLHQASGLRSPRSARPGPRRHEGWRLSLRRKQGEGAGHVGSVGLGDVGHPSHGQSEGGGPGPVTAGPRGRWLLWLLSPGRGSPLCWLRPQAARALASVCVVTRASCGPGTAEGSSPGLHLDFLSSVPHAARSVLVLVLASPRRGGGVRLGDPPEATRLAAVEEGEFEFGIRDCRAPVPKPPGADGAAPSCLRGPERASDRPGSRQLVLVAEPDAHLPGAGPVALRQGLGVARRGTATSQPPRSVQPPFRPGTRLEAEWPALRGGPEGHSASQKDVHTGWSGVGSRTVFGLTTCGPAARSLCRLVGALAPHGALAAHLAASHSPAGAVCAWVLPVPSASQGLSGALRCPRPGPRGLHAQRDGAGPRGCGGACYQPRVFTQPHCVPPAPAALASSPARGCGVHRRCRGAGKS